MGALAYWDTNGTNVGAVNTAGAAANGIWGTNPFWNPLADGTGTPVAWNSGDTAVFSAGTTVSGGLATGTNNITVSGTQTAAQLTFEEGINTLSGDTIVLQGAGATAGIIQLSTNQTQTINSVLDGLNGITVIRTSLNGAVTLNAANTFSGTFTLSSGRVNFNTSGAAGVGMIVAGVNTTISSTALPNTVVELANPVTINGNGADISANAGVTISLTGKVSGAGNWNHGLNGPGTLALSNTLNDFSGILSISAGTVVVSADHALGVPGTAAPLSTGSNTTISGTGQVAFQSVSGFNYSTAEQLIINAGTAGTTQISNLGGNNIFGGGLQFNNGTMNTIGVDGGSLTLSGQIISPTLTSKPFTKTGPGTLILSGENTTGFNSTVNLNSGTLRLAGTTATAGDIASATTVNLNNGSLLHLDNSAGNNQDRVGNTASLNFNGANLLLKGSSDDTTSENVGFITFGPGEDVLSTITVDPGAGKSAQFTAGSLTRNPAGLMVFRAPGLGTEVAAGQGQIRFNTAPELTGAGGSGLDKSIIVGALGDTSINGGGSELVTYDEVVGVKPLTTLDFDSTINSGSAVLNNVAIASPQTISEDTTINSLKLIDSGASIAIASGTLTVNTGMILVSTSSTDGISGAGTLAFAGGRDGIIAGAGDLTVSAAINSPTFIKAGTGKLTLSGANTFNTVYVSGGTLLPTVPAALGNNSAVHLGGGGTLELSDQMNLSSVDLFLHDGGRILGRGNASYGRSPQISDGATVILESADADGTLRINDRFLNAGSGAVRPTLSLRGPGTVQFVAPTGTFLGNFELRNNVTVPVEPRTDGLGNTGNAVIFGPGGGTLLMHSIPGGTNWGNPVVLNGNATFQDGSVNGADVFGSLTVNTPSTIHHFLPTGLNFIDPRLNFGNTLLNASVTFDIDRPPIAGDYGRVTVTNVRELNGPKSITKLGEGILTLAGSVGLSGDLNASQGIVIVPDSTPTLSGISGEGIIIGSLNIKPGGHIDPGFKGVGTLLVQGISLNGNAAAKVQLNLQGDATGFDKLFVFGNDQLHLNGDTVINLSNLGGLTNGDYTIIDYPGNPISDADFQKLSLAAPIFSGFNASLLHDPVSTQIKLHLEGGDIPPVWDIDGNGVWSDIANWNPQVLPDGATASVNFLDKITAPRTVTLDGSRTVAQLNISNPHSYTIASDGAGSSLTLGSDEHNAAINVIVGAHVISAPVVMSGNVLMNINAGTSLNMSGGLTITGGKTATMNSSGSLEIGGLQNHGTGATLNVVSGHVKLNSNAGTAATAAAAAYAPLAIRVSGDGAVVLNSDQDLASIRVDFDGLGDQSFDLASPAGTGQFRTVRVYAADLASAKTSLYGAIITANRNGVSNSKDGIFDSGLATHFGMKLGIAELADAHGDDYLMIRPTRSGDLNLDGVVTINDFIALASNFGSTDATWQEGDLNYDGQVTINDFIELASNFNASYSGQVAPISAADAQTLNSFAEAHGATLVPEPGMIGLLGAAGMLLAGRRRRK